jgi:hypothetical protein
MRAGRSRSRSRSGAVPASDLAIRVGTARTSLLPIPGGRRGPRRSSGGWRGLAPPGRASAGPPCRGPRSGRRDGAGIRLLKNGLFAFVVNVSRECADLLERWPADVVVFDWMLTGAAVAAEAAGLPAFALVHCPYPLPVEGVPPLFSGLRPINGPLGSMRDDLMNRIATRLLRTGVPALNRARSERGLPPLDDWAEQLLGAREICVMTAPELDFSSCGALPPNVRYVGPAFEPYPRRIPRPPSHPGCRRRRGKSPDARRRAQAQPVHTLAVRAGEPLSFAHPSVLSPSTSAPAPCSRPSTVKGCGCPSGASAGSRMGNSTK